MEINLEIFGEKLISREIMRTAARAIDLLPAWIAIGEAIEEVEERLFESEGGTGAGGGWEPLAASTVARKAARGEDQRILHATLALRESLTGKTGDSIRIMTPSSFAFGTEVPYAKYHQTGTSKMPARRVVDFTAANKSLVVQVLQRFVLTGDIL